MDRGVNKNGLSRTRIRNRWLVHRGACSTRPAVGSSVIRPAAAAGAAGDVWLKRFGGAGVVRIQIRIQCVAVDGLGLNSIWIARECRIDRSRPLPIDRDAL